MLFDYDIAIYNWITHWPHPQILNYVAIFLHYATRGLIIYVLLIGLLLLKKKYRESIFIVSAMLITTGITDLILKNLVHRTRPFEAIAHALVLYPLPTSYSFPSGQTAVAFAVAATCNIIFQNKRWTWLWAWAVLIGVDRLYMGHHYPSDVVAGAIVGAIIPIIINWVVKFKIKPTE